MTIITPMVNDSPLANNIKYKASVEDSKEDGAEYVQTAKLPRKRPPTTEKERVSSHYAVCPHSGISYTLQDDFKSKGLVTSIYDVKITRKRLVNLITKHGSKCPASYVVGATLMTLEANGLLTQVAQEGKYLRGQINELLINHYDHYQLLALFWLVTNSKAYLKRTPIKLNLTTAMEYPASLFFQITSIARQELKSEDLPRSLDATIAYDKAKKASKKLKLKGVANAKQDPRSAIKRIRTNTLKIAKAIIASQEQIDETKDALLNPLLSYKRAAGLLPDYVGIVKAKRDRIAVLYKELHKEALGHMVIPRDGAVDKSFTVIIKLLEAEIDPVDLEEVEF